MLAVLAVHANVPGFDAGWLGVDLFFVLSGFLITTILRKEYKRTGGVRLKRFYLRRFLRLMPAYYLYAGGITLVFLLGIGARQAHGGWEPSTYIASMWLYFINYVPKGGIWEHQSLTIHLWSLAVEEQFYFIWPFAILLMGKFPNFLRSVSILVAVQIAYVLFFASDGSIAGKLDGRGVGITIGCWFAAYNEQLDTEAKYKFLSGWISSIALLVMFLLASGFEYAGVAQNTVKHWVLIPFCFCCGILAVTGWRNQLPPLLDKIYSWNVLVYIGAISYGVYLYHMVVQELIWMIPIEPESTVMRAAVYGIRFISYIGMTIGLSALSFHLYERPFLRLKDSLPSSRNSS